jgi:hypothetical protein
MKKTQEIEEVCISDTESCWFTWTLSLIFSPNIHLFEIVEEYECSHRDVSQAIYDIYYIKL